ncbi:MAG: ribonuclease III [Anaerotruncus sp.]|nr:ribonuclease III [Anaerotruncus sp.]
MQENPKLYSPLTLAYLGDAVYELCARQWVLSQGNRPVNELHKMGVKLVKADAQSAALAKLEGLLSEEELSVYKRGRNANTNSSPKHANLADYRRATGLEALFGYLYLKGETQRIQQLFALAIG